MEGVPPSRESVAEQLKERTKNREGSVDKTFIGTLNTRPGNITEEIAIETLRNRLLHLKALNERRDPESGNKFDDAVWRNPGKAIYQGSANYFNRIFREWVRSVKCAPVFFPIAFL